MAPQVLYECIYPHFLLVYIIKYTSVYIILSSAIFVSVNATVMFRQFFDLHITHVEATPSA